QAWVIWQQPVGHPLGPDFDEWLLRGTWQTRGLGEPIQVTGAEAALLSMGSGRTSVIPLLPGIGWAPLWSWVRAF
ncbi:MAG: hypothetical protein D6793_11610, partial [Thermoflexia bacterium]